MRLIYSKYVEDFLSCEITAYDYMLDASIFYGLYKAHTRGEYNPLANFIGLLNTSLLKSDKI